MGQGRVDQFSVFCPPAAILRKWFRRSVSLDLHDRLLGELQCDARCADEERVWWEGKTLIVRSVTLFGADSLKTLDSWTLSENGKELTLHAKHQYRDEPEGESVFVFERRRPSVWDAQKSDKTAESVYKNIQILKGAPANHLNDVMALFSKSLGVSCAHCHVSGDFATDSKAEKQIARNMYEMTNAINRGSFGSSETVTCWMCHRGAVKPER